MVTSGKGTGGAFAMNPLRAVIDDFFASDVVADEINKVALRSGEDILECFEDEGVDEHVVDGGEVGTHGHVIKVGVSFRRTERGINELSVAGWIGEMPFFEEFFESFELAAGEVVPESARSAVAEEGDVIVFQTKDLGGVAGFVGISDFYDLSFAEVVAAAVGSELGNFPWESVVVAAALHAGEAFFEGGDVAIVAEVGAIFATASPLDGDSEFGEDFGSGTAGDCFPSKLNADAAGFPGVALTATSTSGGALANGFDQSTADAFIGDGVFGNIKLQQGHGAFDIDTDGPWVNVGRRDHDAADGGTVAGMGIGVENEVSDAGCFTGVEGLGDACFIEADTDGISANDGDGLGVAVFGREDAGGFACFMDGLVMDHKEDLRYI